MVSQQKQQASWQTAEHQQPPPSPKLLPGAEAEPEAPADDADQDNTALLSEASADSDTRPAGALPVADTAANHRAGRPADSQQPSEEGDQRTQRQSEPAPPAAPSFPTPYRRSTADLLAAPAGSREQQQQPQASTPQAPVSQRAALRTCRSLGTKPVLRDSMLSRRRTADSGAQPQASRPPWRSFSMDQLSTAPRRANSGWQRQPLPPASRLQAPSSARPSRDLRQPAALHGVSEPAAPRQPQPAASYAPVAPGWTPAQPSRDDRQPAAEQEPAGLAMPRASRQSAGPAWSSAQPGRAWEQAFPPPEAAPEPANLPEGSPARPRSYWWTPGVDEPPAYPPAQPGAHLARGSKACSWCTAALLLEHRTVVRQDNCMQASTLSETRECRRKHSASGERSQPSCAGHLWLAGSVGRPGECRCSRWQPAASTWAGGGRARVRPCPQPAAGRHAHVARDAQAQAAHGRRQVGPASRAGACRRAARSTPGLCPGALRLAT